MAILTVSNIGVSYDGMKALQGVSLKFDQGDIVGIAGPNGSGKTSLLRAIAGSVPVNSGRIEFEHTVLSDANTRSRKRPRETVKLGVSLVPEGRGLFAGLSVEDHLRFGAYLVGLDTADTLEHVYTLFPRLHERRKQDVASLSGGEKQMVAIGRALMAKPKLLMIDELALGLAPVVVKTLLDALRKLNESTGITIILVDESLARLGSAVSSIVFLAHGRVLAVQRPDELSEDAAALYFAQD
jgi:branched-chain amino acid transport system ATP-binding protein